MSGCTVGHVCKGPQMHTHTPCHSKVKRQAGVGCGGAGEPKISLDLEVSDSEMEPCPPREDTHSCAHRYNSLVAQLPRAALIHTLGK